MIISSENKLANSGHRHFNFQLDKVNHANVHHIEAASGVKIDAKTTCPPSLVLSLVSMLNLRVFFAFGGATPWDKF